MNFVYKGIANYYELSDFATIQTFVSQRTLRIVSDDTSFGIGDISDEDTLEIEVIETGQTDFRPFADVVEFVRISDGSEFGVVLALAAGDTPPEPPTEVYDLRIRGEDVPIEPGQSADEALFFAGLRFNLLNFGEEGDILTGEFGAGQPLEFADIEELAFLGPSEVNLLSGTGEARQDLVETIALMFEAGLDRDGDIAEAGLNFRVDSVAKGLSLGRLAGAFLDTDEFQSAAEAFLADGTDLTDATVRDPEAFSNADYVRFLYGNVLDRAPGQDGFDFYLGRLEDLLAEPATAPTAREQMLIAFARSQENRDGSPFVGDLTETLPGIREFA